jgi:hypothetical protein
MNFELLAPAVDNSIGVFGRLEESGSISTKIVIWVMGCILAKTSMQRVKGVLRSH